MINYTRINSAILTELDRMWRLSPCKCATTDRIAVKAGRAGAIRRVKKCHVGLVKLKSTLASGLVHNANSPELSDCARFTKPR